MRRAAALWLFVFFVVCCLSLPVPAPAAEKAKPTASGPSPTKAETAGPVKEPTAFRHPIFKFPQKLTLCGEPVPLDNPWVYEMLDREFQVNVYDTAQVIMWAKRAGRWFPAIEAALAKAGMPDDIKYQAVAESALKEWAYSSAGAAGPWQFIRSTGRRYGLKRDNYLDDRLDFDKATQAALTYLKELYAMFGSWPVAMAAYNCGEDRMQLEIENQGVKDYFLLNLPRETERYIFRILAIKIILSHPERYGYDFSKIFIYKPRKTETVTIRAVKRIHIRYLAEAAGTTFKVIKELNPALRKYHLPPGIHRLKVPQGQAAGFTKRLAGILQGAPHTPVVKKGPDIKSAKIRPAGHRIYVVKKGDTLTDISARLDVSVGYLKKVNHIRGDVIRIGQKLRY